MKSYILIYLVSLISIIKELAIINITNSFKLKLKIFYIAYRPLQLKKSIASW